MFDQLISLKTKYNIYRETFIYKVKAENNVNDFGCHFFNFRIRQFMNV